MADLPPQDIPVCQGCGSSKLLTTDRGCDTFYAVCQDCLRLQEVETRADPTRQLCDNCACRPGSQERADAWGWMLWEELHIEEGVPFYCHKGLPLDFDPKGSTHIAHTAETMLEAYGKPCAGWLARRKAYLAMQVQP